MRKICIPMKISFEGSAVFIAEHINDEKLANQMNVDNNGHEAFLSALERVVV